MNINKDQSQSKFYKKISFYTCGSLGLIFLRRNMKRMKKYINDYFQFQNLLTQKHSNIGNMQNLKNSNQKQLMLLPNIFPTFPNHYFKNIQNFTKYKTFQAKFYESLIFEKGFEGTMKIKGKEYQIYFQMNRPTVGSVVAQTALQYDARGMNFHKTQVICVYGHLHYPKQAKRYKMQVKMLGLDTIEIEHYWQKKLLANILSNFYFSFLLGIAISIQINSQILTKQSITKNIQQLIQKCQQIMNNFSTNKQQQQISNLTQSQSQFK